MQFILLPSDIIKNYELLYVKFNKKSSLCVQTKTWFESDSATFHHWSTTKENLGMKKMHTEGNRVTLPLYTNLLRSLSNSLPLKFSKFKRWYSFSPLPPKWRSGKALMSLHFCILTFSECLSTLPQNWTSHFNH